MSIFIKNKKRLAQNQPFNNLYSENYFYLNKPFKEDKASPPVSPSPEPPSNPPNLPNIPAVSWKLTNAWPKKYTVEGFKANGNVVSMETIVLAHEGVTPA